MSDLLDQAWKNAAVFQAAALHLPPGPEYDLLDAIARALSLAGESQERAMGLGALPAHQVPLG